MGIQTVVNADGHRDRERTSTTEEKVMQRQSSWNGGKVSKDIGLTGGGCGRYIELGHEREEILYVRSRQFRCSMASW